MINKIEFKLCKSVNWNENMGSAMHGMLMEKISVDYAKQMHEQGLRPYSTSLEYSNNTWKWIVNTLNIEAYNEITMKLKDKRGICINHINAYIDLDNYVEKTIDIGYMDILYSSAYSNDRVYEIEFVTPTSFKVQGEYVIFPNEKLILQSILNRYNLYEDKLDIELDELVDRSKIISYDLHSVKFHLEGIKVAAFRGKVTLTIKKATRGIDGLIKYGEYSGVGIKTALGMGSIRVKYIK